MVTPIRRYLGTDGLRRDFATSSANRIVSKVMSIYMRTIVTFEIISRLNAYNAQTNNAFFQSANSSMPSAYSAASVPPSSTKFIPRPVHFVKLPGNSEHTVFNRK